MTGWPELTASVTASAVGVVALPELALTSQLVAAPLAKIKVPIVRGASSVTVLLTLVNVSVLKSAIPSVLVAMTPPCQLAAVSQLPEAVLFVAVITRLVQVPLVAEAVTAASRSAAVKAEGIARFQNLVVLFMVVLVLGCTRRRRQRGRQQAAWVMRLISFLLG